MNRVRDSGVDLVLRSIEFSYTSQRQKFFKYDFECTHDLPEIDRDCETNYRLSPTVWRQNVGISITAFARLKGLKIGKMNIGPALMGWGFILI